MPSQAAVGLAVGGWADRAIARGVPLARLRKGLQTVGLLGGDRVFQNSYPLVNKHSYGKLPFIVDFPIENGDFL